MQGMETTAYDLDTFAPRRQRQRQPLKVVKNKKRRKLLGIDLRVVKIVALASIFLALVASVLYSHTTATELAGRIKTEQDALVELESEYAYLNNELDMKSNIATVEEYATGQLGLVKMDRSQVTYVYGGDENTITRTKTGFGRLTDQLQKGILSAMEYLTS